MSAFIIGIGGTGSRCIEAIVHLASLGLYEELDELNILIVDPDETNGNLDRTQRTIEAYQKCYKLGLSDPKYPWMKTAINFMGVWSPFEKIGVNKDLSSFFQSDLLRSKEDPLANLFDVLYTKDEQEADLDVGFRGRPAIGAAVMSQVKLDTMERGVWGDLIKKINNKAGGGDTPKVFLCGSIFGGTGASGLPTIGRLLHNKLEDDNQRSKVKLGSIFVLPYFGFTPDPDADKTEKVYARSENFLLNTEAALRYYGSQTQNCFDTVYLLGNQALSQVGRFKTGKKDQRNNAHFIELYSALAARQFLLQPQSKNGQIAFINRKEFGAVTWGDLPESANLQTELNNATRFAFAWLSDIAPGLKAAEGEKLGTVIRLIPWVVKFYSSRDRPREGEIDFNSSQEKEIIQTITDWCKVYLNWLVMLHNSTKREQVGLYNTHYFKKADKLNIDHFSDLIVGDARDQSAKKRDTVDALERRFNPRALSPPNNGTVGLAKALYLVCRL